MLFFLIANFFDLFLFKNFWQFIIEIHIFRFSEIVFNSLLVFNTMFLFMLNLITSFSAIATQRSFDGLEL